MSNSIDEKIDCLKELIRMMKEKNEPHTWKGCWLDASIMLHKIKPFPHCEELASVMEGDVMNCLDKEHYEWMSHVFECIDLMIKNQCIITPRNPPWWKQN
jgi:hypothetical protein